MSEEELRVWKIGRLFQLVTAARPDVTMGNDEEHFCLRFYGATRTTRLDHHMLDDSIDVELLASAILEGLHNYEPDTNSRFDRRRKPYFKS